MCEPYLPTELWLKICSSFNPKDITQIILLIKNKKNKETVINISFEICRKYYRNIHPQVEKLFILKTNINKITTRKIWIDYYSQFNYSRDFINKNFNLFINYSIKFQKEINNERNKEKYGNILRIKSFI